MAAFSPIRVNTAITIFIIVGYSPFIQLRACARPPGHIVSSVQLQDAVIHGGVLTDQGEHCDHHLHHSWIFSFHSIEGLCPPPGHIFILL